MRVSPPRISPTVMPSPRPQAEAAGSLDAHRQTGFVLEAEVDLVLRGLELEGAIASASADAKHRTQRMAAAYGPWSRSWLCRLEALHCVQRANYVAALPLVRSAADYIAAEAELLRTDAVEWQEWLDTGGIAAAPGEHGTEFRLHPFRSGETLAINAVLGAVYRAATDLSLPHFGATLLVTAMDSTPERVLMTFGERDFHLGLAEIALGWLLQLSAAQLEACGEHSDVFNMSGSGPIETFLAEAAKVVERRDRCRVEAVERGGVQRYVVSNWRRRPGDAGKRVLS